MVHGKSVIASCYQFKCAELLKDNCCLSLDAFDVEEFVTMHTI